MIKGIHIAVEDHGDYGVLIADGPSAELLLEHAAMELLGMRHNYGRWVEVPAKGYRYRIVGVGHYKGRLLGAIEIEWPDYPGKDYRAGYVLDDDFEADDIANYSTKIYVEVRVEAKPDYDRDTYPDYEAALYEVKVRATEPNEYVQHDSWTSYMSSIKLGIPEPDVTSLEVHPMQLLTVAQAAKTLGIQPATVRQQIAKGRLDASKHGRDWFIRYQSVLDYAATHSRRGQAS